METVVEFLHVSLLIQDGGRIMMENIVDNNLKLTINDLRPTDTHNYTCRTDNRGGTFFRNGTITVQCK